MKLDSTVQRLTWIEKKFDRMIGILALNAAILIYILIFA